METKTNNIESNEDNKNHKNICNNSNNNNIFSSYNEDNLNENIINNININNNNNNSHYIKSLICFGDRNCGDLQQKCIKFSNKIIIPEDVLKDLLLKNYDMPFFFRVINPQIEFGVICGVHEASAPPGICYIPNHIMNNLNVKEGNNIKLELVKNVINGTHIKLQPHSMDFVNMKNVDPKELLEKSMSKNYPILTKGHTIVIYCNTNKRSYYLDVIETKPSEEIKIIDVNLNVDFAPPIDFLRNKKREEEAKQKEEERLELERKMLEDKKNEEFIKNEYDKKRFPGSGFRLGS